MNIALQAVGDAALKVTFSKVVSPALNRDIQMFCQKLQQVEWNEIIEWVPAYDAVTIYYLAHKISFHRLCEKIYHLHISPIEMKNVSSRLLHIPVTYDGPDLQRVADYNELSIEAVMKLHQNSEYLVYMLGFLPGFPYLGGLDTSIATPRLEKPRAKTKAGSVGIAHEQTGIYPVDSPGGWNIIGKTPLRLFDSNNARSPFLFHSGDWIRFYAVSESEYERIENQVKENKFKVEMEER